MSSPIASGQPPTAWTSFCPVGGEGALGDEGAVVGGLHPLDAVDAEPVVPLLHPGQEVGVLVLNDDGAGTGAHVLILRILGHPGDEVLQGVGVEVGVGVEGDHQRRLDRLEHPVEGVELARLRLEHPPIVEAQPRRRRLGELGGAVGRVVVRQHHLDGTQIRRRGESLQRRLDRVLLVPRRDHDRHRRPLAGRPRPSRRVELEAVIRSHDQRRCHEPDHQPRDVRQEQRDHPRHHRPDRLIELIPPRPRRPNRERDPARRQHDRQAEPHRRPHPRNRMLPPRKPAHRTRRHGRQHPTALPSWRPPFGVAL